MTDSGTIGTDPFTLLNEKADLERYSGASFTVIIRSRMFPNCDIVFFNYDVFQVDVTTTKRGNQLIIHMLVVDAENERGKGDGTKVLCALLATAKKYDLSVVAQEVLRPSERFWQKNGFVRCPEPNPKNNYFFQVP